MLLYLHLYCDVLAKYLRIREFILSAILFGSLHAGSVKERPSNLHIHWQDSDSLDNSIHDLVLVNLKECNNALLSYQ